MRTWADVQAFVAKHVLPYKVLRFNMSRAGVLVDTFTDRSVANTVREARRLLR